MKEDKRASAVLKKYIRWSWLFPVLAWAAAIHMLLINGPVTWQPFMWLGIITLAAAVIYFSYNRNITRLLVGFAMNVEAAQSQLSSDLDVPYAFMDMNGYFTWRNRAMNGIILGDPAARKDIRFLFSAMDDEAIAALEDESEIHGVYKGRGYRVKFRKADIDGTPMWAVFLYDETSLIEMTKRWQDERPVVGLIYLDNYDEAMDNVEEVRRSLISALIDRKIGKYIADAEGVTRKLEKDKHLFILSRKNYNRLEEGRFDILEDVKTVTTGSEMKVTLSIGVGLEGKSYAADYEMARAAIDMALARGGDQAIVKERETTRYYGGKSQSIEKSTRVKARVKAQALSELIDSKDELFVMGHRLADIDSLGAAVGLWKIAEAKGKKAHIVMNEVSPAIKNAYEKLKSGDYPEDMFVTGAEALDMIGEGSLLAVVDVNRPGLTEAPELLNAVRTIVVLDHHRQASDIIEQATLSYVEPYASSTCEMVAEIVQYISDDIKLRSAEADAMYGGIVIDTNGFTNQTGVRTFEAAAYLRKQGADVMRVRKLFRDSPEDYYAKSEAIHNAEIFMEAFAISVCRAEGCSSPTVIGAQAANELLDIGGIKASVVLTDYNNTIYLSARSMDEVNVQMMMEKLGGGGHRTIAGAQLSGVTAEEAAARVREVIAEMVEKGDIQ